MPLPELVFVLSLLKGGSISYFRPLYLIVFLFLLIPSSQFAFAKHFNTDSTENEENLNPTRKLCLQEIFQSPITKSFYPNILNNFEMLTQLDKYCACTAKRRVDEDRLKKDDQIAWQFFDRKILYEIKDQCAQEHLDNEMLGLNYTVIFAAHFYPLMDHFLEKQYPQMVRRLASLNSYNGHMSCVKEKIRKKCSKIQSLRMTYSCITENTKYSEKSLSSPNECPGFQTQGEEKVPETEENFI